MCVWSDEAWGSSHFCFCSSWRSQILIPYLFFCRGKGVALIKWTVSVSVAHLSPNPAGHMEFHWGNIMEHLRWAHLSPPRSPSWHFVLFLKNIISGVPFPSWFLVLCLPVHPTYPARKGLGKYLNHRVANSGPSAATSGMLLRNWRKGPIRRLSCVRGVSDGNEHERDACRHLAGAFFAWAVFTATDLGKQLGIASVGDY